MKVGRRTNLYYKIRKLLNTGIEADKEIGVALLLKKMPEMHPWEWEDLNTNPYWRHTKYIKAEDIQKALYDKRRQEEESLRKDSKAIKERT